MKPLSTGFVFTDAEGKPPFSKSSFRVQMQVAWPPGANEHPYVYPSLPLAVYFGYDRHSRTPPAYIFEVQAVTTGKPYTPHEAVSFVPVKNRTTIQTVTPFGRYDPRLPVSFVEVVGRHDFPKITVDEWVRLAVHAQGGLASNSGFAIFSQNYLNGEEVDEEYATDVYFRQEANKSPARILNTVAACRWRTKSPLLAQTCAYEAANAAIVEALSAGTIWYDPRLVAAKAYQG